MWTHAKSWLIINFQRHRNQFKTMELSTKKGESFILIKKKEYLNEN